ncbi:MAG TPA: NAD-dependent epimerase/dehydratase family protein [Verrucomicrobiae bacterium]|nr:NAD-dependent epimerase/dehydratase family protein [Verrucomicrobiae bacterium]
MRVTIIGANGLVGSAFARLLGRQPDIELTCVTRQNFDALPAAHSDVVIEAACNSRKFLADQDPAGEFAASVQHRLLSLQKFTAGLQLHISSVDVYNDVSSPGTTREDAPIDVRSSSRYGFHKHLAEQLVQHYASSWLIVRLAGMVGPGLRKNPVFDIINGQPLRIHPDSRYQFMLTDEVAQVAWALVQTGFRQQIFNVCGTGLISMREVAAIAQRDLNLAMLPADAIPRVVEASNEKLAALFPVNSSVYAIETFLREHRAPNLGRG